MHDQSDAQLLRDYAELGNEAAFREIVVRHADLVYSAALRQVASPDLARDVAQSVFTDLAAKARSLVGKPAGESLAGWLYRGTRFAALNLLRDDRRRQARERQAMEHFDPASETAPDWERVRPVLDEAMADLCDEDREALLLRFFKSHDFRAIGQSLGVSDDAAQKRVSRALEKLRVHLTSRGVTTSAVALSTALSANAVVVAPAGLVATLSTAALVGSTTLAATATATAAKTIAMTTLQKTLIVVTLAAAGTGIYEVRQASILRGQVQTLRQQQSPLAEQVQQLTRERDEAISRLALENHSRSLSNEQQSELLRLRSEVTRLRDAEQQLARLKTSATETDNPFIQSVLALTARAAELNEHLEQMPDKRIPELQFLTENDWLDAARDASFNSDADIRKALSKLRSLAKSRFGNRLIRALDEYIEKNDGQLPADVSQLKPFFEVPVDDAILQRYRMLFTGYVTNLPPDTTWVISERAPVDRDYDSHFYAGPKGRSGSWGTGKGETGDPDETWATRQ